jgi:hypothetical protein
LYISGRTALKVAVVVQAGEIPIPREEAPVEALVESDTLTLTTTTPIREVTVAAGVQVEEQ